MAAKLLVARATLAVRAGERRRRRQLERELAAYASPADRLEIEAIIERYPPWQTQELREILARQACQAAARTTGLGGRPTAW